MTQNKTANTKSGCVSGLLRGSCTHNAAAGSIPGHYRGGNSEHRRAAAAGSPRQRGKGAKGAPSNFTCVRSAQAGAPSDEARIKAAVRATPGGFGGINGRIEARMRKWFAQVACELLQRHWPRAGPSCWHQ